MTQDNGGRWRATVTGAAGWEVWFDRGQWEMPWDIQRRAEERASLDGHFGVVSIALVSRVEQVRERWGDDAAARMAAAVAADELRATEEAAEVSVAEAVARARRDRWYRSSAGQEALARIDSAELARSSGYDAAAEAATDARALVQYERLRCELAEETRRRVALREVEEYSRPAQEAYDKAVADFERSRSAVTVAVAAAGAGAGESAALTPTVIDSDASDEGPEAGEAVGGSAAVVEVRCNVSVAI
jgi:hypothetical protein